MKNRGKTLVVMVLVGLAVMGAYMWSNEVGTYRVTHVYDGDTIVVDMQGASETIRMIGADTPETVDPRKPVQCYGPEASAYTHATLRAGMRVRLVADPLSSDRDRYGRLLRYVYLSDGTLYEEHLIEQGFAHAYIGFPFSRMQQFIQTEARAKSLKNGLWAACPAP